MEVNHLEYRGGTNQEYTFTVSPTEDLTSLAIEFVARSIVSERAEVARLAASIVDGPGGIFRVTIEDGDLPNRNETYEYVAAVTTVGEEVPLSGGLLIVRETVAA